jgi:hypothetical protein
MKALNQHKEKQQGKWSSFQVRVTAIGDRTAARNPLPNPGL